MRVLHLIRDRGDALAWEAVITDAATGEVRVVLAEPSSDGAPPGAGQVSRAAGPGPGETAAALGIDVTELGRDLDYDGLMALIEWSDKVVAW